MLEKTCFKIKNPLMRKIALLIFVAARAEYLIADLLPYMAGVFLGIYIASPDNLTLFLNNNFQTIIVGLTIVFLAHFSSAWVNSISDYELDKKFKPYSPAAVDQIGRKILWLFVIAGYITGTLITILLLKDLIYVILWFIGAFLAFNYSSEPLRLKKHLILNDLARGLPLIITLIFGYMIINQEFTLLLLLYSAGLFCNLQGLFLFGQTWDFKDDKPFVKTVATVYGYKKALTYGCILMPFGFLLTIFGYLSAINENLNSIKTGYLLFQFLLLLAVIFSAFKIYKDKNDYEKIEKRCGQFTTIGTTSIWLTILIGTVILCL